MSDETKWIRCSDRLPPNDLLVKTKIDNENGIRNEQDMIRDGSLWFHKDKSTYVYYEPTHWAYQ